MVLSNVFVLAQATGSNSMVGMLVPFALVFAVMYFLVLRPRQKQVAEQRNLHSSLKKGDKVVTQGGLIGRIYAVADREITLEISNGVRVQVLKTSVQGKVAPVEEVAPAKAEEKEEK